MLCFAQIRKVLLRLSTKFLLILLRILSAYSYLQGFNASYSCVSSSSKVWWQPVRVRRYTSASTSRYASGSMAVGP